jgi:CDGSH-type Zn-finger protein
MSKAQIAAKEPAILRLEAGTYHWCACGKSKNQPFCDGSHEGSEFSPKTFEITSTRNVALCQCKQTRNPPFCDGTHVEL